MTRKEVRKTGKDLLIYVIERVGNTLEKDIFIAQNYTTVWFQRDFFKDCTVLMGRDSFC